MCTDTDRQEIFKITERNKAHQNELHWNQIFEVAAPIKAIEGIFVYECFMVCYRYLFLLATAGFVIV